LAWFFFCELFGVVSCRVSLSLSFFPVFVIIYSLYHSISCICEYLLSPSLYLLYLWLFTLSIIISPVFVIIYSLYHSIFCICNYLLSLCPIFVITYFLYLSPLSLLLSGCYFSVSLIIISPVSLPHLLFSV